MKSTGANRRDWLCWLGAAGAAAGMAGLPLRAEATPLERVRERGTLTVGIYQDMPPFHAGGKGIDVELAQALAESLGVRLSLLPFHADENMADDLRHMVWRGHYLGYGPADVLLHVPVDRPLMDANPQVTILAPYCRDRVAIARRLDRVPRLDTLSQLADGRVAVPGQSLAGWLLIGADNGAYRNQLITQWKDGTEATRALLRDEVVAAAGLASELESVLRGDTRFEIAPLPSPRAPRDGWAVGMAVKRASTELAQALQRAVNEMAASGRLAQIFERGNVAWRAA
ncbi:MULTISPECIES: transporter substrate-binding domain-containing protein [unclassified Variovorax]|uniref:substrate-binding periplasmic protein n=1 Tax=unclassified Variovorax TaxID=663243 RepID=UPI00076D2CFD|nr:MULTISPECIES: transporter substrate-binding domain-containing protein [unclassified Variovorax]KWT96773.1 putative periplasmic binding protein [Variovorax sp. WDL1]PNG47242.1 L-cystine-binding protein FliY [Variovorax sp. B2]PNG48107.1 L-cystine-binding protein FliY [Variovorax sp. B4]VTV15126.1 Sulfate starvation-induced protein 7 [Variovorax sp. WDL1]